MSRLVLLLLLAPLALLAEPRPLTLQQAVQLALRQNPDLLLARVDAEKAAQGVAAARGAFATQAYAGSGLGWTDGIPQSIEGATPAIVQASARRTVYDGAALARVKEARALAEAAGHSAAAREDEAAFQVAVAWLNLDASDRQISVLEERLPRLRSIEEAIGQRVREGRALPLEESAARLDRLRTERMTEMERSRRRSLAATLASYLGLDPAEGIDPVGEAPAPADGPADAAASAARAVEQSPELDGLEAQAAAKRFAVRAEKAASKPRLDFVAQYSLLSRFNNYEEFFNRFQRHNGQAGIALRVPLFRSRDVSARIGQAEVESRKAELTLEARRSSVAAESAQAFEAVEQAETAQQIARLELDFSREKVDVALAKMEEGRAALDEVERARVEESLAWQKLYDSRYEVERTRLNLLRRTGDLAAMFR
ncbi:MAG: hypothetical protein GC160_26945 [Acidobacteria bacterium]|nr:hypothetical protein [Acidobacteriota bacterium]